MLSILAAGCQPDGEVTYQPEFLPIEFKLDVHGHVSVGFGRRFVTFLGVFSFEGGVGATITPSKPDDMLVLIRRQVDGADTQDAYEIAGTDTLTVCSDGALKEKVSTHRVVLTGAPGTTLRVIRGDAPDSACDASPAAADSEGTQAAGPVPACPPQVAGRLPGAAGAGATLHDFYQTNRFSIWICRSADGQLWYHGVAQFRPQDWLVGPAAPDSGGYRMTRGETSILITDRVLDIVVGSQRSGDSVVAFAHYPAP